MSMEIDRREFLKYATVAAAVTGTPVFSGPQGEGNMWGMIAKITVSPGKRDEMIRVLRESAANMPGCLSYIVAKDAADENVLWVTEAWDSQASHDASLSLPAVKNAIPQGKALITGFEKVATTTPVWGVGLLPS
jgi:quinol monooxygenase YgiN